MAAVLKEFKLNPEEYSYISIETRESGIINFLLNLLKLDPSVKMVCNDESIDFEMSSLKGSLKQVIPLSACTEVVTAIHKPISVLIVAAIFAILFVVTLIAGAGADDNVAEIIAAFLLLISIVCAVFYILNKKILFAVKNGGDSYAAAIYAQPAVIAGQRIDGQKFIEAANILRDKINKANRK